jgi:hypothetical protein
MYTAYPRAAIDPATDNLTDHLLKTSDLNELKNKIQKKLNRGKQ